MKYLTQPKLSPLAVVLFVGILLLMALASGADGAERVPKAASVADEPGVLTGGALSAKEELAVLEQVIRYGVRKLGTPVCLNYGSKDAYCLRMIEGHEPPQQLLRNLADVRPPILSEAACRSRGFLERGAVTTDPMISVDWIRMVPDGAVQARVVVYCWVSEPMLRRQGSRWDVQDAGVVGCGPIPGDCVEGCDRYHSELALDLLLRDKDLGDVYIEDRADRGSVVTAPPSHRGARLEWGPSFSSERPERAGVLGGAFVPLLFCEAQAAAVLVEHLDDTRLTYAKFRGGAHWWSSPIRIPLGVLCLDILIALSPPSSPVRDPETKNTDKLGAGVRPEYYFRPDEYDIESGRYHPKPHVFAVKKAWQKALREGLARFEYSDWHKGIR